MTGTSKMVKTFKIMAIRQPRNYWINRRVYADENGVEYVKINYNYYSLDYLRAHGWDVMPNY